MHLEEFAEGSTFLHRLDPRVKFITASPFIMAVSVMGGLRGPVFALFVSSLLALAARLHPKKLLGRLAAVNLFVLVLWLFLPFSVEGKTIFSIGQLRASSEGVLLVLSITLKTNAIVLATVSVFGTSEVFSLAHALVHLRAPGKLIHLFFFFYRYISVLHEEYLRLRRAMRLRGFKPATNMHTYRTFAYLVGMLIVRSHERSEGIYRAMLCRGFKDRFPVMRHFGLTPKDVLAGAGMALASALAIFAGWGEF